MRSKYVVIKGGGDLASAVAMKLYLVGFQVLIIERPFPLMVRRTVSFGSAVYENEVEIEGVKGKKVVSYEEALSCFTQGIIPVLVDEAGRVLEERKPDVFIDATLSKVNVSTRQDLADLVIGLGPGFEAGKDVHMVVETNRGHNLGRVILTGSAEENTGVPGIIGGYGKERVLRAPRDGVTRHKAKIGDLVQAGDIITYVDEEGVKTPISGVLRGLIQEGIPVVKDMKIGDVDPRGQVDNCFSISDKGRNIAGGVLEAILRSEVNG